MSTMTYPFDPSGLAATNLITGERHTLILPPTLSDFYLVIPRAAPYFKESLKVKHYPSGNLLVEGVDYVCTHLFHAASLRTGKAVYGSITLYDHTLSGTLDFSYQTIGGEWTLDVNKIVEILSSKVVNPRITSWEQVATPPNAFPPINHEFDINDFTGASHIVAKLFDIREAISASGDGAITQHVADKENPHGVTKAQVGLALVENYTVASAGEAASGTSNNLYMTPLRVKQAIDVIAGAALTAHINDKTNPHTVTKLQVGLGSVENYGVATQAEAEAANSNLLYMTPLRVKQAIDILVGQSLQSHVANKSNPHGVTKSQVSLGNVQNYGIATRVEAETGDSNLKYMTPLRTKEAITALFGTFFDQHITNDANPHNVTKLQVGLGNVQDYSVASKEEAEAGLSNEKYMTPLATRYAIAVMADSAVGTHAIDRDNPHQVTKAQVGLGNVENYAAASQQDAEDGNANDLYMTALRVKQAISAQVRNALDLHVGNISNPHNVTAGQVGAYSKAEADSLFSAKLDVSAQAADAAMAFGLTKSGLYDEIGSLTVSNAEKLDGLTLDEVAEYAQAGTADNALKVGGSTKEQLVAEFISVSGAVQQITLPPIRTVTMEDGVTQSSPTDSWTLIGTVEDLVTRDGFMQDITLLLAGGSSNDTGEAPLLQANLSFDKSGVGGVGDLTIVKAQCQQLNDQRPGYVLYHRITESGNNAVCELWIRNEINREAVTVTELSRRAIAFATPVRVSEIEQLTVVQPTNTVAFNDLGEIITAAALEAAVDAAIAELGL